jgi:hypothetical protein
VHEPNHFWRSLRFVSQKSNLDTIPFDRLEGRARQHLDVADVTKELREKSDGELLFHLAHNRWPEEGEALPPVNDLDELNGQTEKEKE